MSEGSSEEGYERKCVPQKLQSTTNYDKYSDSSNMILVKGNVRVKSEPQSDYDDDDNDNKKAILDSLVTVKEEIDVIDPEKYDTNGIKCVIKEQDEMNDESNEDISADRFPAAKRPNSPDRHVNKRYKCEDCHQEFAYRSLFLIHRRNHTGEKPFKCVFCHESFVDPVLLRKHIQTHPKRIECHLCGKKSRRFLMIRHIEAHKAVVSHSPVLSNTMELLCKQDSDAASSEYNIDVSESERNQHYLGMTMGEETTRTKISKKTKITRNESGVTTKDKTARNNSELINEEETTNNNFEMTKEDEPTRKEDEIFNCAVCRGVFRSRARLVRHAKSCKKKVCDECGEEFFKTRDFMAHRRQHNLKPYPCAVCGKRFRVPYLLRAHQRTHIRVNPFLCDICGQRFADQVTLDHHIKSHSGQKCYLCPVCSQIFLKKSSLNGHKHIHSQTMHPWACDDCGGSFKFLSLLRQHQSEAHADRAITMGTEKVGGK